MAKKHKFRQKFEDLMGAIAFAEAGEFDIAREMVPTGWRKQGRRKIVLLGIEGCEIERKGILYVSNLCKRIDAGLEMLQVVPQKEQLKDARNNLDRILSALKAEKIEVKVVHRIGSYEKEMFKHIRDRRDIQSVVCNHVTQGVPLRKDISKRLFKQCEKMGWPMVVVS